MIRASLLALLAFLSGCASTASDDEEASASSDSELHVTAGYIADVSAAGTGCPAGSWAADISPDGQTFTLTFNAYEVKVSPGQSFDMKACVINVGFRDANNRPVSFLIGSIAHQGFALLDRSGMRAQRNTTYTFGGRNEQGAPLRSRAMVTGPYDASYTQTDDVLAGRWSACSAVSNLVVNTNLMLQNDVQRTGSGYLNNAVVDGALTMAFRVAWRHC